MLRPKLNRIWASNSSVLRRDPGDTKYIQGWISEIPTYQVLNYLQYKIDTTLLALAERGIFEWGADVTYGLGSVVWNESDKTIYIATVAAPNKTKAPSANTSQWAASAIQVSRASYDAIVKAINDHIAIVSGNPHGITADMLNAYTKAQTDAIVQQYQALVAAHSTRKDNPHSVTATQIGAVPATGGTYTGDVIFNGGLFMDSGKTQELSKSGGLFLRNGTAVVGLNSSGVPVAGKTTSQSPIIREDTFASQKILVEPDYAVPAPTFQVPFVNDMSIAIGPPITIGSDSTTDNFSPEGGRYFGDTVGVPQNVGISGEVGTGAVGATLAADIYFETVYTDGTTPWGINLGSSGTNIKLYIKDNCTFYGQAGGQNTATVGPYPIQTWHRVVTKFEANYVAVYIDGVLANRSNKSTAIPPLAGGQSLVQESSNTSVNKPKVRFRNVRFWPVPLTDNQISAL